MSILKRMLPVVLFVAVALLLLGKTAVFANTPSDDNIDNPIIAIEKTAVTPEIVKGGIAEFSITVINSGDVPLTNVRVEDPLTPTCKNTLGALAPGQQQTYTCQRTNVQASFLNEATVSGRDPNGVVVSDTDTALINVDNPEISIDKATITPVIQRNGTAIFTITVFNDSETNALSSVEVVDPLVPNCDREIGRLEAQSSHSYICTIANVTEAFNNVATVTGTSPASGAVSTSDDAQIEILDLEMELVANPALTPEPGNIIQFTAKITNTGSVDVHLTSLTSTRFGDLLDSSNSNVSNNTCASNSSAPTLVANGGEYTCEFESPITGQPQVITVDIMATADDEYENDVTVSETTNGSVTITNTPSAIAVEFEASQTSISSPGGVLEFTATIHNESPVDTITIDTLDNNIIGNLNNHGTCALPQAISSGSSYSCTIPITITGGSGTSIPVSLLAAGFDDDITPHSVEDEAQVSIAITPPLVQYLPIAVKNWRTTDEPNNVCTQAYALNLFNHQYRFAPNDKNDWYMFDLDSQVSTMSVTVSNFVPRQGQVVVYKWNGVNCESTANGGSRQIVGFNNTLNTTSRTVTLNNLAKGYYLVLVINDGTTSQTKYNLVMTIP
ncbi:MAG: hypothetical protein KC423_04370 [Anaerolineales bacterium]|nr:hypothetical protein [Anaerolineales bacterium]